MRCLELFAGIGGFSAAFPHAKIVNAVDIDLEAANVYRANFAHPFSVQEICSLTTEWFAQQDAALWWMSPPCTPFSRRGLFKDHNDTRAQALLHLVDIVTKVQPPIICIENVVGFERSRTMEMLSTRWKQHGYRIESCTFCPTEIGWPNRRPRIYIIASLDPLRKLNRHFDPLPKTRLADLLDPFHPVSITSEERELYWLSTSQLNQYAAALDRIDPARSDSIAACFASSYGRSIIHSGSYILDQGSYRRFSPREMARLMGYSDDFILPDQLGTKTLWRLLGNSVNILALRAVFKSVFD